MKYQGKTVPRYKYNIGTKVTLNIAGKPQGKVSYHEYDFYAKTWKYRVNVPGSTTKTRSEKTLRKVRRG